MFMPLLVLSTILTFSTEASALIIGGSLVNANDPIAASTVGLMIRTQEGTGGCTGSIIAKNLILTAAHCVVDKQKRVLPAGNFQIVFGTNMQLPAPTITAWGVAVHGNYNGLNGIDKYDVALIAFDGELPNGYRPAKLIRQEDEPEIGEIVTLAGFGVTNGFNDTGSGTLRKADVRVLDFLGETEVMMDQRYGKGACRGDSGGPAFIKRGSEYHVFGVTSRGAQLCNDTGIYTSVNAYADFIPQARVELFRKYNRREVENFHSLDNIFNLTFGAQVDRVENRAWSGRCYLASNPNKAVGAGFYLRENSNRTGVEMSDWWNMNNPAAFNGLRLNDIQGSTNASFYSVTYPSQEFESTKTGTNYYSIRESGNSIVAELKNSNTNAVFARCFYDQANR